MAHVRHRRQRRLLAASAAGCLHLVARARLSRSALRRRRVSVAFRHLRRDIRRSRHVASQGRAPRPCHDIGVSGRVTSPDLILYRYT